MISIEKSRHSERLNTCSYVHMFNCSNDDDSAASNTKCLTVLSIFCVPLSMLISVNSDIRLVSFRLFSSSFSMLLFGGLQHRKNIQYLLTGYVYILGHLLSVAVTPSCSTPLTPLKFKSETPLYSPTPNPTPNPSLSSLINTPFGIKFRYNSTPTLLNPP